MRMCGMFNLLLCKFRKVWSYVTLNDLTETSKVRPSGVLDLKKKKKKLKGTVALWLFGFLGNVGLKTKFKTRAVGI